MKRNVQFERDAHTHAAQSRKMGNGIIVKLTKIISLPFKKAYLSMMIWNFAFGMCVRVVASHRIKAIVGKSTTPCRQSMQMKDQDKKAKKETRSSQAFLLQLIRLCEYYEFRFVCLDREKSEAEQKRNALEERLVLLSVIQNTSSLPVVGTFFVLFLCPDGLILGIFLSYQFGVLLLLSSKTIPRINRLHKNK